MESLIIAGVLVLIAILVVFSTIKIVPQARAGIVERLGRWGMLDVLLVALLVAMVKLGDLVNIYPGQGLTAFIALVLLSLVAGLMFNPQLMWQEVQEPSGD